MSANAPQISGKLLDWYDRHARDLPWRVGPTEAAAGKRADPYKVWLSEIMLQQTTVAAVKEYFLKFTSLWPTVHDLAAASEEDVLKAWAGLGYYSRARNLKKCADIVVAKYGGVFPSDLDALRELPGIGDYTSAAIASIAFNIPAPVVDGNVERVFSRLYAIDTPLPKAKVEIKGKVALELSNERPGDFAQACMDLGATLCTPKRPSCLPCPLRDDCAALAHYDPEHFPVKAPKKAKPVRVGAAFVIEREDSSILVEKRLGAGLLANMTQVPTTDWNSRQDGDTTTDASPLPNETWLRCGEIEHVFTHFTLRLTVWRHVISADEISLTVNQWWSMRDDVFDEALPTVMKKVLECALSKENIGEFNGRHKTHSTHRVRHRTSAHTL